MSTSVDNDILGVRKVKRMTNFNSNYSIKFDALGVEESIEVLEKLGYIQNELPVGFKLKKLNFKREDYDMISPRVHYSPEVNDGLTFQLNVFCKMQKARECCNCYN